MKGGDYVNTWIEEECYRIMAAGILYKDKLKRSGVVFKGENDECTLRRKSMTISYNDDFEEEENNINE